MECEGDRNELNFHDKIKDFVDDEKMVENHTEIVPDKENSNPNKETNVNNEPQRRHDEPSELKFEICESFVVVLIFFFDRWHQSSLSSQHKRQLYVHIVVIFVTVPENAEEKTKRQQIEEALKKQTITTLDQWREFAKSEYGLINGKCCEISITLCC